MQRKLIAALLVALSTGMAQGAAPTSSGDYAYLIDWKTVHLSGPGTPETPACSAATGSDSTLAALTAHGVTGRARFTLERLPRPVFERPAGPGEVGSDRYAVVRGQKVSPICPDGAFYWIRKIEILPGG